MSKVVPRCPYCNVTGLKKVSTRKVSSKAVLVYCSNCNAVHGVVPLTFKQPELPPQPEQPELTPQKAELPQFVPHLIKPKEKIKSNDQYVQSVALTIPQLAYILKHVINRPHHQPVQLTTAQAAYMTSQTKPTTFTRVPYCPHHWQQMIRLIIPKDFLGADKPFWACPEFQSCKHWEWEEACPICGHNMRRMSTDQGWTVVCGNCQYQEDVNTPIPFKPIEIPAPVKPPENTIPTSDQVSQQVDISLPPTNPWHTWITDLTKASLLQIVIISAIVGLFASLHPLPGQSPLPIGILGIRMIFMTFGFGIFGGTYTLAIVFAIGEYFGATNEVSRKDIIDMATKGAYIWAIIMSMICTPFLYIIFIYIIPSSLSIIHIAVIGIVAGIMFGVPIGAIVGAFSRLIGR